MGITSSIFIFFKDSDYFGERREQGDIVLVCNQGQNIAFPIICSIVVDLPVLAGLVVSRRLTISFQTMFLTLSLRLWMRLGTWGSYFPKK
jgi:hypothetical protein